MPLPVDRCQRALGGPLAREQHQPAHEPLRTSVTWFEQANCRVGLLRRTTLALGTLSASLILLTGCAFLPEGWDLPLLQSAGPVESSPAEKGFVYESLRIPTAEGKELGAWFVPAQPGPARATALVHTGMRGNLDRYLDIIPWFAEAGFDLLIYDWQGFGDSDGEADFANFEADTNAVIAYLLARPEPAARRLVHVGISLGGLPAIAAAADYPDQSVGVALYASPLPDTVVRELMVQQFGAGFAPLAEIITAVWMASFPPYLDPRNQVDRLRAPVFAIIPEDDTGVPVAAQEELYQILPQPKERYATFGGHGGAPFEDPELRTSLIDWARHLDGLIALP